MRSIGELRQQLRPRQPPYPPLRQQLEPRQPPYPPPIHLLVARDRYLGGKKTERTVDGRSVSQTISRRQRRELAVHVHPLVKLCWQVARSAYTSAELTTKGHSRVRQRENPPKGLCDTPVSVDQDSTVRSHCSHARKRRNESIQQHQATEKYSCAYKAEKAARPKTWSSSSDDRFDGASEEDVEMNCKPGDIQKKRRFL